MKQYGKPRARWNTWPIALLVGAFAIAFGPEPFGFLRDVTIIIFNR